ncbi:MAG TPA: O-antigen ligase family protein [Lacunisphaera sp.]|nr:O-antigen ligase family protein [Lacunisphaera sp.]
MIFLGYYLAGVLLMGLGYFVERSAALGLAYGAACIVFSGTYIVYFGLLRSVQRSYLNWVYLFFLFPKKALPENSSSLLGQWFDAQRFSFFEYFELTVVVALLIRSMRSRQVRSSFLRQTLTAKVFFCGLCLMVAVGAGHFLLRAGEIAGHYESPLKIWRTLWPLVVAVVVWVPSPFVLTDSGIVARIRKVALFTGVVLVAEFLVSAGTQLVPESIRYYMYDVDTGGFRSAWQSSGFESGLLLSLLLIFALPFIYPTCWSRHKVLSVVLAGLFLLVIAQTYWRGPLVGGLGAAFLVAWLAARRFRWLIVAAACAAVLGVTANWSGKYLLVKELGLENAKDEGTSYFNLETLSHRFGAQIRGFEVFSYYPLFGCGPGNLSMAMGDAGIPPVLDYREMSEKSREMYRSVTDPAYASNTHNLLVDLSAQYGVVGLTTCLLFLFILGCSGIRVYRTTNGPGAGSLATIRTRIAAISSLAGFCVYYTTQAAPLVFGCMALLYHMADRPGNTDRCET